MVKVALTAGIFDMCHHGHINLLSTMALVGDVTIVVVHSDESCYRIKGKFPVQSLETRIRFLKATGLVDHVLVTDIDDPGPQFSAAVCMMPGSEFFFIRGDDNAAFPGRYMVEGLDMDILLVPYTEGISSTTIREAL